MVQLFWAVCVYLIPFLDKQRLYNVKYYGMFTRMRYAEDETQGAADRRKING